MPQRRRLLALVQFFAMLLVSACATNAAKKTPTATKTQTATPVLTPPPLTFKPAHLLTWTVHQLPFTVPVGE
jgi:hypothetical protein